jgi:hypothetical protein
MISARTLVAVVAIAICCGCATPTVTYNPDIEPKTEKLPSIQKRALNAGIYYSPEFATYAGFRRQGGISITAMKLGSASVAYFDELYARVFEKTARVDSLAPGHLAAKGVDLVVAPSLEYFDIAGGMQSYSERYGLAYRTTVYSTSGIPVGSWVVFGTHDHTKMTFITFGRLIEEYMADAGVKFIEGFDRQSDTALKAAVAQRRAAGKPIEAASVAVTAQRDELPELDRERVARLRQRGIVPLRVTATSALDRALVMRTSDMRLRFKDGRTLPALNFSDVSAESQAVPTGGLFLLGPIGALAEVYSANEQSQREREAAQKGGGEKLFGERTLKTNASATGVVFFRLPENSKPGEGGRLSYWLVDPVTGDGVPAETDVPALQ